MPYNLDARARRVATKADMIARKSAWRKGSCDNFGDFMLLDPSTNDFMLLDPSTNFVVAGFCYDMTAEEVITFCTDNPVSVAA